MKKIDYSKIKKILVVRNDRFGEFLLNIPAFRALKETFLYAKISLVVNPYVKELAELIPYIDEIITWENRKHKFLEIIKFSLILRRKNFNLCIIFNPSKEFNIISFLASIPIRVGYARKWDFLLTHKIEDTKYLGLKHEVEYNLELVGLVGAKTEDKSLSLNITEDFTIPQIKDVSNLVAIHPWTSDPIKQWPIENFVELAKRICENKTIKVVIIGGAQEEKNKQIFNHIEAENIINLTGKTTLKELASLLKKCRLLISGDSGPVHLASCVGTKVVVLFRNDIPAKSAKRWRPWGEGHIIIEKPTLSEITVEEVLDKIDL